MPRPWVTSKRSRSCVRRAASAPDSCGSRSSRTPLPRLAPYPYTYAYQVRSVCQGMAAANGRRSMKLQPSKGAVRTARGALLASSAGPAARTAPRTPGASPGTDPAARSRRAFAAGRTFPQALQADQTCGELHRTGLAPRPTRPRSPGAQPGPRAPLRLSGRRTTMPLSLSENGREGMETSEPVGAAPGSRVGASPRTRSVPNRPLGRTTAVLTSRQGDQGADRPGELRPPGTRPGRQRAAVELLSADQLGGNEGTSAEGLPVSAAQVTHLRPGSAVAGDLLCGLEAAHERAFLALEPAGGQSVTKLIRGQRVQAVRCCTRAGAPADCLNCLAGRNVTKTRLSGVDCQDVHPG